MHTRKDLSQRFNVSENTVNQTLQICGLGTGKQEYTAQEIQELFAPARKMLSDGKTYQEVKKHFQSQVREPLKRQKEEEFEQLSFAVAQGIANAVQKSVRAVLPFLPAWLLNLLIKSSKSRASTFNESQQRF